MCLHGIELHRPYIDAVVLTCPECGSDISTVFMLDRHCRKCSGSWLHSSDLIEQREFLVNWIVDLDTNRLNHKAVYDHLFEKFPQKEEANGSTQTNPKT